MMLVTKMMKISEEPIESVLMSIQKLVTACVDCRRIGSTFKYSFQVYCPCFQKRFKEGRLQLLI